MKGGKCVHIVTRGHFRSRDKDGGHTTRSAVFKNPQGNRSLLCGKEWAFWTFYIAGTGIFDLFGTYDLDLDPMTYEPDPYCRELYGMCK